MSEFWAQAAALVWGPITVAVLVGTGIYLTRIGSFVTDARLTFGIHPRVIAIERNLGHWGVGHIARAKRFKSKDPNTDLVWWEKEGNGISPNPIISGNSDPIGGGEAWNDTLVIVSKA